MLAARCLMLNSYMIDRYFSVHLTTNIGDVKLSTNVVYERNGLWDVMLLCTFGNDLHCKLAFPIGLCLTLDILIASNCVKQKKIERIRLKAFMFSITTSLIEKLLKRTKLF